MNETLDSICEHENEIFELSRSIIVQKIEFYLHYLLLLRYYETVRRVMHRWVQRGAPFAAAPLNIFSGTALVVAVNN